MHLSDLIPVAVKQLPIGKLLGSPVVKLLVSVLSKRFDTERVELVLETLKLIAEEKPEATVAELIDDPVLQSVTLEKLSESKHNEKITPDCVAICPRCNLLGTLGEFAPKLVKEDL